MTSVFEADTWDTWHGAFALYCVAALIVGSVARPFATALVCTIVGAVLALTSKLPVEETAVLLAVPYAGGWLATAFRGAHVGSGWYLPGTVLPLCGVTAVFFESWAPTALMACVVCASRFLAPRLGPRAVLSAGVVPTLLALATLLLFELG